jgi:hypothetical protein
MPWIDYRSELRRPVSLVLLGLAVLGWIVVARLAWQSGRRGELSSESCGSLSL